MAKIQSLNGTAGKETIYVDVDDEITTIIDKVQAAKSKVIALVLPKRAPVLQSIVNMKLLKRTAENADKNLVLITTENGLLPLAGAVGLHVAGTPTSKPSVPNAPSLPGDEAEDVDEPLSIVDGNADEAGTDFDRSAAAGKTVGELAADTSADTADDDIDESIDMGEEPDGTPEEPGTPAPKPKKDKKLKVPNFDSFRKKIVLGIVVLAVLIAGWVYAFIVAPKATVTIHTDSSTITSNLNLTLDTAAKTLDADNDVVPATVQSQQKTSTQQVPATGQQNNGQKATGSVDFTAQKCGGNPFVAPGSVSAGTSLSSGGHTYILQETVSFHGTGSSGGGCYTYSGGSADITALKAGTDYNITSSADFSVTSRSDVSGSGSASGGTDDIIKVVAPSDIDGATGKITSDDSDGVKQQLISNVASKGFVPVPTTFLAGTPQVTTSAKAGDQADTVTVTAVTTYTMLGVQKSDLQTLVDANVNSQLDKGKQVILDDGVANADFTEANPATSGGAVVSMETKSEAGPQLNVAQIKTQLAGKKSGDIKNLIKQTPGVTGVDVHFSPFWVSVVPKNTSKTTIHIVKAGS